MAPNNAVHHSAWGTSQSDPRSRPQCVVPGRSQQVPPLQTCVRSFQILLCGKALWQPLADLVYFPRIARLDTSGAWHSSEWSLDTG